MNDNLSNLNKNELKEIIEKYKIELKSKPEQFKNKFNKLYRMVTYNNNNYFVKEFPIEYKETLELYHTNLAKKFRTDGIIPETQDLRFYQNHAISKYTKGIHYYARQGEVISHKYINKVFDKIKKMHDAVDEKKLTTKFNNFNYNDSINVDTVKIDKFNGDWKKYRDYYKKLFANLKKEDIKFDEVLSHNNISSKNIAMISDEIYIIDFDRVSLNSRYFDYATFLNFYQHDYDYTDVELEKHNLDVRILNKFRGLQAYIKSKSYNTKIDKLEDFKEIRIFEKYIKHFQFQKHLQSGNVWSVNDENYIQMKTLFKWYDYGEGFLNYFREILQIKKFEEAQLLIDFHIMWTREIFLEYFMYLESFYRNNYELKSLNGWTKNDKLPEAVSNTLTELSSVRNYIVHGNKDDLEHFGKSLDEYFEYAEQQITTILEAKNNFWEIAKIRDIFIERKRRLNKDNEIINKIISLAKSIIDKHKLEQLKE